MLSKEAPLRDRLQPETTDASDLRDSLAARWIARPSGVTDDEFQDPLGGFSTKTILATITRKIGDLDAIEMAFVARTLDSMHLKGQIPQVFVPQCVGLVTQIKTSQRTERGRLFPIKLVKV